MHSAHTHGLGYAHTTPKPCAQRRVVARAGPYRGPLPNSVVPVSYSVVMRTRELARRVTAPCHRPLVAIQNCNVTSRPLSHTLRPCHSVHAVVSRVVSRPKRSSPATIQFLYRDSPLARPCAHALPHTPRASRPCGRSYRGRLLAVLQACSAMSWSCPA